jgi:2',3'-cyclic-nucleotide 2'-phosphodiesterase (5'-nucleotidase family)
MAAQDYEQVTYNSPDGAQMGASSVEKIGFHGATPTTQAATIASLTASTTLTQSVVLLNSVIQVLKDKGLIAS